MSRIDELIEKLCLDGVEFKEIQTLLNNHIISTVSPPKKLTKNLYQVKGTFPIIDQGQEFIVGFTDIKDVIVKQGKYVIFGDHTEAIKYVDFAFAQGADGIKIIKSDDEKIIAKYLFYALHNYYFKTGKYTRHFGFLKKTSIPVPPIEIQEEIVKTLDLFTVLEDELEAELEARKAQYTFYRDTLFRFEGKNVEWKTLGEIGEFTRGKRFVKTDIVSEGVPCIHYGEMYTHYKIWAKESKSFLQPDLAAKLRTAKTGDVIIVAAGETIEDIGQGVAWLGKADVVIHDACFAFSHDMHPNYVSHFLQTDIFHSQIKRHISSGKISAINSSGLSKAKIPVPPIEEQQRIASILDKFHILINDISIGIPAEIEGRRKQYEYYRNILLSFKNESNG